MGPLQHYINLEDTSKHGRSDNTEWKKRMNFILNVNNRLGFLSFNELDYILGFLSFEESPESIRRCSEYLESLNGKFIASVRQDGSYIKLLVDKSELDELKKSAEPPINEFDAKNYVFKEFNFISEELKRYEKWMGEDNPQIEYEVEE